MMRILLVALMTLGLGLSILPSARAQIESREAIALQNQMLELRRDLQSLRDMASHTAPVPSSQGSVIGGRSVAQNAAPQSGDMTAQLLDRVTAMEETLRRLNGRIDEVDFARQRAEADLAKQIADLTFRLDNPTPAAGAKPGVAVPPATSTAPATGTLSPPPGNLGKVPATPQAAGVKRTAELALQEGNAALGRRDYVAAEAAAREVLENNKAGPRGYDAQFLLAQSLAGGRKSTDAAIAFGETYNAAKQGSHAQDALIGYAINLTTIGEKKAACDTLDILRSQFPNARADIVARATTARQTAACR